VAKLAENYVWWPSEDVKRQSTWQAFINAEGLEDYYDLVVRANGDGDGYSIGGNHFLHACRRNVDLTYIVMDNHARPPRARLCHGARGDGAL
jgi:pyruvate/2-oxoacid:ferredoxin oxidoreductase beta subunit